jgi:hypothetical protein
MKLVISRSVFVDKMLLVRSCDLSIWVLLGIGRGLSGGSSSAWPKADTYSDGR